ncbi:MAG: MBL fold metallo-hydrolase, partial [Planctomycetota bacterium]
WKATCLRDTPFWVDGGAIFHMTPKVMWEKKVEIDEQGRVPVALNCLLLQNGEHNILLDAGIGENYNKRLANIYNLDRSISLLDDFKEAEISENDIDLVILTHLHLDHTGWLRKGRGKEAAPFFKNARHIIQQKEWESAFNTNELTRGSYIQRDFSILENTGSLELIDGDCEILPGIELKFTGGHSAGHQILELTSEGEKLICPAEIVPDIHHFRLAWVMSFDEVPGMVVEIKKEILKYAVEKDAILFLGHEMGDVFGRVEKDRQEYMFAAITRN